MRVLVVEDQKKTADYIRTALMEAGFTVEVSGDGEAALRLLAGSAFDAIILDIMLPGIDGLTVLRTIRADTKNRTPVILLTARGGVDERIGGLDAGADDYLPKPFSMEELVARVRALCRRGAGDAKATVLRVGDLSLDTLSRQAHRGKRGIHLSTREFLLLEYLMRCVGRVCARMAIVENVWAYDFDPGTNLVDVYVKRIREKIDLEGEMKLIHTVRGIGYMMKDPGA